jgi:hypothetical protein
MKKMGPGMGVMSFSKSKAKLFAQSETKVTFADVAGIDEAKEELQEVVEFFLLAQSLTQEITEQVNCPVLWVKEYEEMESFWVRLFKPLPEEEENA